MYSRSRSAGSYAGRPVAAGVPREKPSADTSSFATNRSMNRTGFSAATYSSSDSGKRTRCARSAPVMYPMSAHVDGSPPTHMHNLHAVTYFSHSLTTAWEREYIRALSGGSFMIRDSSAEVRQAAARLRKEMTPAEERLWRVLRDRAVNAHK